MNSYVEMWVSVGGVEIATPVPVHHPLPLFLYAWFYRHLVTIARVICIYYCP